MLQNYIMFYSTNCYVIRQNIDVAEMEVTHSNIMAITLSLSLWEGTS
jgi:hypothetical protein